MRRFSQFISDRKLRLSRSSLYCEPQPVPEAELAIMRVDRDVTKRLKDLLDDLDERIKMVEASPAAAGQAPGR
jgi:hypothetical protein